MYVAMRADKLGRSRPTGKVPMGVDTTPDTAGSDVVCEPGTLADRRGKRWEMLVERIAALPIKGPLPSNRGALENAPEVEAAFTLRGTPDSSPKDVVDEEEEEEENAAAVEEE